VAITLACGGDLDIALDVRTRRRCADQVGTPFSEIMVGIATVMVLVPGTSDAGGYDFDFCVNEMTPV